jgi:hypothetical protein
MVRLWLAMGVGVACLVMSGVVASLARAQPTSDPTTVITAYEVARNRRDIDTALSYFAEDAAISQRNTTFSGKDEIRRFLESLATRSRFVVVSDRRVTGNHVTWTERAGGTGGEPQVRPPQGLSAAQSGASGFTINVEAIVQDGKIHSIVYALGSQPARVDPSLDSREQLPASIGLGAVLTVLLAVLLIASTGLRRTARGVSTLRGRLLDGLQGWSAARQ